MTFVTPISLLRQLPPEARPRERLRALGPDALSDAELLALLLGSGGRGRDVLALSASLLRDFDGLAGLAAASVADLHAHPGVGPARAALLRAAFAVGRRAAGARPHHGRRLGRASEVWSHLRARLADRPVEEFWALGLDVRHRLRLEACLARGCLTGVEVHPRDVFRALIREGVAAVIFCHNHPSGDPSPSPDDLALTARLREVGSLCGIAVLDHVIVAAEGYVSLAERGWPAAGLPGGGCSAVRATAP